MFRIFDLSYIINTVIHIQTVDIHFHLFCFLCHLQINYRGCEGNTDAEFQAEGKTKETKEIALKHK